MEFQQLKEKCYSFIKYDLKDNLKRKIIIYFSVLLIITAGFILNYMTIGLYNSFGIKPRSFSFIGIFLSWTMHVDFDHFKNNMLILSQLLLAFLIVEKKPIQKLLLLIILTGLFVYIFGMPLTNHIGASGLIFALFGYMLGSVLFRFNIFYLIAFIILGIEIFYSMSNGLIQGFTGGISFAAHFGGLIVGLIVVFLEKKI